MSLRSILSGGRLSGWKFVTSAGNDLSLEEFAFSTGSIVVQPYGAPGNTGQMTLLFVATGAGISVPGMRGGIDNSTYAMFSTGRIFTLTERALTRSDFQGGCVVISAGATSDRGVSVGLLLFGAPLSLTAACFETQGFPLAAGLGLAGVPLLMTGGILNHFAEDAFWRSFKGFALIWGENQGAAQPGISALRGVMR